VMVVGVFGLDAAKVSHGAEVVGLTGSNAEGALVTVTGCCTGPPPNVALRNTTLGVAEMVFCACSDTTVPASAAAIAKRRIKYVKGFKFNPPARRLHTIHACRTEPLARSGPL
jgi:hypothetical protein